MQGRERPAGPEPDQRKLLISKQRLAGTGWRTEQVENVQRKNTKEKNP